MSKVELNDIQGIVIKGYGAMPHATYLLLHFDALDQTRKWLLELSTQITDAATSTKDIDRALNISFTNSGMRGLGLDTDVMNTFSREFDEGMVTDHRQRILGDFGESDPQNWEWGASEDKNSVQACLMVFAKTKEILEQELNVQKNQLSKYGINAIKELTTHWLPENKEHFGFRDGIANPVMKNSDRNEEKEHPANLINPGEFVFGYKNEYDKYPISPHVSPESDKNNLLPTHPEHSNRKDLGYNGSMMVFRQMEQDVTGFWKFIHEKVEEQNQGGANTTIERMSAKMVGRWQDGSPLAKCPIAPDEKYAGFDNFGYAQKDFDGFNCPIGAHIRRTNPRDNFLRNSTNSREKDMEKSQKFMKRFRILRRGRTYGPPVSSKMNPHEIVLTKPDNVERGIHFICFNTNIGRQFELIQQTWVNNPKFAGLYEDPDPIIGYPEIMGEGATTTFTEQAKPLRRKVTGIPRFVQIKGGAYFFMPGIKALKYLASE